MVLKRGPNKGELSAAEIRTLIRGHNKLSQIKVPTRLDRDGLIKFLKSKKYTVDHEKQMLVDNISGGSSRGRKVTLAKAKDITKRVPKVKPAPAQTEDKVLQIEDSKKAKVSVNKALRRKMNLEFKKLYKKSIYTALGIGTQAESEANPKSPAQIKEICRKLKLKNHPDKGGDADVFSSIQEACDIFMKTFRD